MPSPSTDPYGPNSDEAETILPPPPKVPQILQESGTVLRTERIPESDLVAENVRLRTLLSRVINARVSELHMVISDIEDELGSWSKL